MPKRILFQFDCDPLPSSFDAVVAIDSGVDHLIPYAGVQATSIEPLVHGAMFTRGGDDLRNTAIFLGGSDVAAAENLLRCVTETFFGPVRVSVMMDAGGCNTTASAAVVAAARHISLDGASAVVLGGTGPVGQRVARLLLSDGCDVTLTSRSQSRAEKIGQQVCDDLSRGRSSEPDSFRKRLSAKELDSPDDVHAILAQANIVIACGAAGVQLATESDLTSAPDLAVAIDLNAVPPSGLGGISVMDKAKPISETSNAVGYGAIGVGGLKMKTHRAAVRSLFESNDRVLNIDQIYELAQSVDAAS